MRRWGLLIVVGIFLTQHAIAGEFQDDLKTRRSRFMERLGPNAMLILWSAPVKVYSIDVDYEFRQDSNFYYLTGIDQPESIFVMMPGNRTQKEFLFVKPRDVMREHWDGHMLSAQEATAESGIPTVYLTTEFQPFLDAILSQKAFGPGLNEQEFETF